MDRKKVQKWALITVAALVLIIVVQIAIKLIRVNKKEAEQSVKVSFVAAQAKEIIEDVAIQGVAQGDPQVKVYPIVKGKFERALVTEGDRVRKDQAIIYINRDMVGGMDYQLAPVKSPINGIVTKIYFSDRGASVSSDYPIAEVADPENIKVVLSVGEEEMVKVKNGMEAEIKSVYDADKAIKATVYSSTPFIDSDTMSGTIIVKGKNAGMLIKPGMSVDVRVLIGKRKAVMLPESAVLMGDGKTYVYINEAGKAKRADIETGFMSGAEIEAKSGVTEGAQVITEGNFKLSDGTKIEVR